jgi:hypothetical protein
MVFAIATDVCQRALSLRSFPFALAYFPRDPSLQCILDKRNVVERMYGLLVDPLRYLGLSDSELCLFYAIIIFSASQPFLSPNLIN